VNGLGWLERAASDLVPLGAAIAAAPIAASTPELHPHERHAASKYGPRRLREFSWGRSCSRRALERIGGPAGAPIGVLPTGAPEWPPGYMGSISHTAGAAIAIAAPAVAFQGIGIDLAADLELELDRAPLWCTPSEMGRIVALPETERSSHLARRFAAKESARKSMAHTLGSIPGDLSLDLVPARRRLSSPNPTVRFWARCSGIRVSVQVVRCRHLLVAVAVARAAIVNSALEPSANARCFFRSSNSRRTA